MFCATAQRRERLENFDLYSFRPANSHGFAVSLTIFCHFSRSHDKAPNLTAFGEISF